MLRRAAAGVGRFLLADASKNTSNPLHKLTGKKLKPWITATAATGLIGGGAVSAAMEIRRTDQAGAYVGITPVPRYSADGQENIPGMFRGGDPTLGARGDIVFGLRNMSRRY